MDWRIVRRYGQGSRKASVPYDAEEAKQFVEATKVDVLAPASATSRDAREYGQRRRSKAAEYRTDSRD